MAPSPSLVFLVSTKFPILALSPISEPSLRRAYGPILQLEPTVAEERWLKDSTIELSPIETSCKTTFDLMVTFSPKDTLPSNITFTSTEQSLPASTSPRTSTRVASKSVIPCSNNFSALIFLKIDSSSCSSYLLFAPSTSFGSA